MDEQAANGAKPVLTAQSETAVSAAAPNAKPKEATQTHTQTVPKSKTKKKIDSDAAKGTPKAKTEDKSKLQHSENQAKEIKSNGTEKNSTITTSSGGNKAYITVTCVEGTDVFVDGIMKGRINTSPLTIAVSPGNHTVIVSHTSRGILTQSIKANSGKTVHIKPSLCN